MALPILLPRIRCPVPFSSGSYDSALERTRGGSSAPFAGHHLLQYNSAPYSASSTSMQPQQPVTPCKAQHGGMVLASPPSLEGPTPLSSRSNSSPLSLDDLRISTPAGRHSASAAARRQSACIAHVCHLMYTRMSFDGNTPSSHRSSRRRASTTGECQTTYMQDSHGVFCMPLNGALDSCYGHRLFCLTFCSLCCRLHCHLSRRLQLSRPCLADGSLCAPSAGTLMPLSSFRQSPLRDTTAFGPCIHRGGHPTLKPLSDRPRAYILHLILSWSVPAKNYLHDCLWLLAPALCATGPPRPVNCISVRHALEVNVSGCFLGKEGSAAG